MKKVLVVQDSTIFKRILNNFMKIEVLTTMNLPTITAFKAVLEMIILIIQLIKVLK